MDRLRRWGKDTYNESQMNQIEDGERGGENFEGETGSVDSCVTSV